MNFLMIHKISLCDHAKSQLPPALQPRVVQRWQFRGHGDNLNTGRSAVAGRIYKAYLTATHEICQPERVSGGSVKRTLRA